MRGAGYTHKDTIAVAIAEAGQSKPRYYGEIANTPEAVAKLVRKLSTLAHKFGDVFAHAAWADICSCAWILERSTSRSWRVNFHSKGRAVAL